MGHPSISVFVSLLLIYLCLDANIQRLSLIDGLFFGLRFSHPNALADPPA